MGARWSVGFTLSSMSPCEEQGTVINERAKRGFWDLSQEINEYKTSRYHYN